MQLFFVCPSVSWTLLLHDQVAVGRALACAPWELFRLWLGVYVVLSLRAGVFLGSTPLVSLLLVAF